MIVPVTLCAVDATFRRSQCGHNMAEMHKYLSIKHTLLFIHVPVSTIQHSTKRYGKEHQ